MRTAALFLTVVALTGCDRYFLDPYLGQLENAAPADIHVLVNLEWAKVPDSCLNSARQKVEYMRLHGHDPEIMVIRPYKDPYQTHALVVENGTVYDNGYLSEMPFDYEDLAFYGTRVPWKEP